MSIVCSAIKVALPAVDGAVLGSQLESHVAHCSTCRVEVEVYKRMYRDLRALDHSIEAAPAGLVSGVMENLGPVAVEVHEQRRERIAPAAAAAVVATAAAGTVVLLKLYRARAA